MERCFAITLDDHEVSRVLTVGDLCELVLASVAATVTRAEVEEAVRRLVADELGQPFESVTLEARFVEDLGVD